MSGAVLGTRIQHDSAGKALAILESSILAPSPGYTLTVTCGGVGGDGVRGRVGKSPSLGPNPHHELNRPLWVWGPAWVFFNGSSGGIQMRKSTVFGV